MRFCNSFLALVTAFILVAVGLERYRKICRPLHKQHSLRRSTVSIVVCAGVSVALTIPFTVLNGRQTVDTGVGNITGVTCSIDNEFVNTMFPMIYNLIMTIAFLTCVTIMIVSYSRIARDLLRHRKKSAVSGSHPASAGGGGDGDGGWREGSSAKDDTSDVKESASSELLPSSSAGEIVPLTARAAYGTPDTNAGTSNMIRDTAMTPGDNVVLLAVVGTDKPPSIFQGQDDTGRTSDPTSVDVTGPTGSKPDEQMDKSAPGVPSRLLVSESPRVLSTSAKNEKEQKSTPLPKSVLSKGRKNLSGKSASVSISTTPTRKRRGAVKKIPTSTTFMMFVLTAFFIINYLPHIIIITARAAVDDVGKGLTGFGLNAYNIGLRSYFINCAVNSIVYGFCNARFRQECRRFCSRRVI
nr:hypothetical protein BaRGS_027107 [Batillaria attramentaria]